MLSAMDKFLLDTNVISEMVRPQPEPSVVAFLADAGDPWISSITLHELSYGAERAPDPRRRAKLLAWIGRIEAEFAERTILVDGAVAERSGTLRALAAAQGRTVTVVDSVIAASAQLHGLLIATRNVRDFETFGIEVRNPWMPNTEA